MCEKCQKLTPAPQQIALLFDNFVGALIEVQGDIEAERLGGLEIDHQLELDRCLHG
jgi:hypothetical protein